MGNGFHHESVRNLVENTAHESVMTEAEIIENHQHNYERWFGASGGQIGPGLQTSLTPFRVTSAALANGFGTPVTIFTGIETPTQFGMTKFDFHRVHIVDAQNNNKTYRLRFANSSRGHGSFADAVAGGVYTDIAFRLSNAANQPIPIPMFSRRLNSGTVVWAAVATLDAVAQWVDFLVGIHEYRE
jgi:hypothetical protein